MCNASRVRTALLAFAAFVAGGVNGFLGTGGGIVLMFALSVIPAATDSEKRDRFAMLIAVILPLCLVSAAVYGADSSFNDSSAYILPGILGGIIGALLLDRINVNFLKRLFALMVIWAGINFLK